MSGRVVKSNNALLKEKPQLQNNAMEKLIKKLNFLKLADIKQNNKPVITTTEKIDKTAVWKVLHVYDAIKWLDDDGKDYTSDEKKAHIIPILKQLNANIDKETNTYKVDWFQHKYGFGRLHSMGSNMSGSQLTHSIRKYCMGHLNHDLDIKRSHPTIACFLLKKFKKPFKNIKEWMDNRDKIIEQSGLKEYEMKPRVNALLNGGALKTAQQGITNKKVLDFLQGYYDECTEVINCVLQINGHLKEQFANYYKEKEQRLKFKLSERRKNGTIVAHTFGEFENKLLYVLKEVVEEKQWVVGSFCNDGLMIHRKEKEDFSTELLRTAEEKIKKKYGIEVHFVEKPMTTKIKIPDNNYQFVKKKLEDEHCLCRVAQMKCFLYKEKGFYNTYKSFASLNEAVTYQVHSIKGPCFEQPIIRKFWSEDPDRRVVKSFGMYPPGCKMEESEDVVNAWNGFYYEEMAEKYKEQIERHELPNVWYFFLKHCGRVTGEPVEELAGGGMNVNENLCWVIEYLAHIIQMPGQKPGTAIVIQSIPGTGKGLLQQILTPLFKYKNKQFHSTIDTVIDKCFGRFNSARKDKLIVFFNEPKPSDLKAYMQPIKAAITDPEFTVEQKGIDPYETIAYDRQMFFSNYDYPVPIEPGDRRFAPFYCKETERLDPEIAQRLDEISRDDESLAQIFAVLKYGFKVNVNKLRIPPRTEARIIAETVYKDVTTQWLDHLAECFADRYTVQGYVNQFYKHMDTFLKSQNRQNFTNPVKLGLNLQKNHDSIIIEKKRTKKGQLYVLNLEKHRRLQGLEEDEGEEQEMNGDVAHMSDLFKSLP